MLKRSLLAIAKDKPRRVHQTLAVDEFGELGGRKRDAAKLARDLGHQMGAWHRRKNDPHGRQDCWCVDCNAGAVVCVEPPHGLALVYGPAVMWKCKP